MLKKYKLGDKIIETTEERYSRDFKDMGYVPYMEKKAVTEKSVENKKISKDK